ncbi:copper resistance protein B [Novosphingobium cyanobacteriorum]|uniref:Copper resistance protein B n=1 Tax=Novosphingobium cyanobacteriorum TaxID=3024215 RepID=A0ABT6CQP6_9SPHN|nr:copper resistance protein B [Novosphingobium cyanobacteriorum]MDF8335475.1 copper resistance protein B [Novosphingobium cyanobacteriorum]
MKTILLAAVTAFALPVPAMAQSDTQSMPGMDMGQKPVPPKEQAAPPIPAPTGKTDDAMPGMDMGQPGDTSIGAAPAPAPPDDHAADALFDPAKMARARAALRQENGAFSGSMVRFDLAELQVRNGSDGYRWEGEGWFGGDIDRLVIRSKGEGSFGQRIEKVEVQALYSRAISPFWNVQVGLRHDIVPNPSRTYAVVGIEGIAPYWLHSTGQVFLSNKGELLARIEGSYDERITQRLILQPRAELDLSAQDVPASGIGSGLSSFELGARLRYEIRREFAPYIGVEWSRKASGTARYSRLRGEDPSAVNFVGGVRFWF